MPAADIEQRVRQVLSNSFGILPEQSSAEAKLEEIGIDWMGRIQLTVDLEREFGLPFIQEEHREQWVTVGDVIAYVTTPHPEQSGSNVAGHS